jgi:pimeloyl-ACP methyl ester carboxylesterase
MRKITKFTALLLSFGLLTLTATYADAYCGKLVTLSTHDETQTKYSLAGLTDKSLMIVVLLPGGPGFMDLDDNVCPQRLKGNSLVKSQTYFHNNEIATALVDAPSDYQDRDGLGGFRIHSDHAADIGKVITDVRRRTNLPVWLIGTSRGSISAANAASRLSGPAAPDGLVLTSPVTSGYVGGYKEWVEQTVFSTSLDAIKIPTLVIAHAEDKCVRTPPELASNITQKISSARKKLIMITGGPDWDGGTSRKACRGKSPHGFLGKRKHVVLKIIDFMHAKNE